MPDLQGSGIFLHQPPASPPMTRAFMKQFFVLLVLLRLFACGDAGHSVAEDPCSELDRADLEMNEIFRQINERHAGKIQFLKNLNQAQVMWVQYRNATAQLHMDETIRPREYSEEQKKCKCGVMAALTRKRVEELRFWLRDFGDIEACW
jgi:uncharacterized protein YecT (DUF1311 family)